MKISLALGPRRVLSRQTAWGCLTSNLAFAGLGSLAAGRRAGYPQLALVLAGMGLTLYAVPKVLLWYTANVSRLRGDDIDPGAAMLEMWEAMRPALLGFALYGAGLLWSIMTGLSLLREAKAAERAAQPPVLREPPKLF